ncbi:hypothetical protein BDZ88DRAFT_10601 [Geranomyces variabilis]|nr:hypothetical protein BDZ88DRAFT_10601 [Geranomyces variabilis]KAJ3143017.1 hypothetical protein HDU90_002891 [Geranomyces variabilis]
MGTPAADELHSLACHAKDLLARAQALLAAIDGLKAAGDKARADAPIEGLAKYRAVVKSEERFLQKLVDNPTTIRGPHVSCSNVPYLAAVWHLICTEPGVTNVYRTFNYAETAGEKRRAGVRVDVVAGSGRSWIKVKASSLKGFNNDLNEAEGLYDDSDEDDDSGNRPSTDEFAQADIPIYAQARQLLKAAEQNLHHFERPAIVMKFLGDEEVDTRILETLQSMGIIIESGQERKLRETDRLLTNIPPVLLPDPCTNISASVNLDVTTLIALVADIAHEKVPSGALDIVPLQLQAEQEKSDPFLPAVYALLAGREVFTTRTALRKFVEILCQLGGPTECERARGLIAAGPHADDFMAELNPQHALHDYPARPIPPIQRPFARVSVVPDQPSERFSALLHATGAKGRKFQHHHLAVFGTADRRRATTVTANAWIERALVDVGLGGLSIWPHNPRSLVEQRVRRYKARVGEA